jgi:hypothetical protein
LPTLWAQLWRAALEQRRIGQLKSVLPQPMSGRRLFMDRELTATTRFETRGFKFL